MQNNHPFYGIHITAELYGINSELLDNLQVLVNALKDGIEDSGATV